MEFRGEQWNRYRDDNKWDIIESPQYVDFFTAAECGDSFFNKSKLIVSTPLPNSQKDAKIDESDSTLIASFKNFALSSMQPYEDNNNQQENSVTEQYGAQDTQANSEAKPQIWDKIKESHITGEYRFTFDLRKKCNKEDKQQKTKTVLESEKDYKVFRANPLPRYLKSRTANKENKNENVIKNQTEKSQKTDNLNKATKKKTEVWKKPPFKPCLIRKNIEYSNPPVLHTTIRAQERKRFDEAIQEKEKQRERMRQIEDAIKKKQEADAIAQLRKQTVFKAQPVPPQKNKVTLPKVGKRPLTDTVSPITVKRRRKITQTQNITKQLIK